MDEENKQSNPGEKEENIDNGVSPDTDLTSTGGAFSSLIQAKIKEQEIKVGEVEQATQARHALMLETLMNIRKSLLDVGRIDLGERYFFDQINDDSQGWPRLRILLRDNLDTEAELPFFQVTAHDRNAQGTLEILAGGMEKAISISLVNSSELAKLPSTLKKAVRAYLDVVSGLILSRQKPLEHQDDDKVALEASIKEGFSESSSGIDNDDLFLEDKSLEDFLEQLPQMGSLDRLPTIEEPESKKTKPEIKTKN